MSTLKERTLFHQQFRGNKYRVVKVNKKALTFAGNCEAPNKKGRKMNIPTGHNPQSLEIQIHEALHACFWDLDDPSVDGAALSIGQFLWKLGWRNVSVPKSEGAAPIQEATIIELSTKHFGRKRQLKLAKSLLGLLVLKIERGDKIPPEFIVECREMAERE